MTHLAINTIKYRSGSWSWSRSWSRSLSGSWSWSRSWSRSLSWSLSWSLSGSWSWSRSWSWIDQSFPALLGEMDKLPDGVKIIRLPFLFERFNRHQPLIKQVLIKARQKNLKVLLDLHNYYRITYPTQRLLQRDELVRFWQDVVVSLSDYRDVIHGYDIMNEPHDTGGQWYATAQAVIDAIRAIDSDTFIHVEGDHWSGAHSWLKNSNKDFLPIGHNLVIHAHQYWDDDSSGTHSGNYYQIEKIDQRLTPWVNWCKMNNYKMAIGETGIEKNNIEFVKALVNYCNTEGIELYYWAMGAWWGNYIFYPDLQMREELAKATVMHTPTTGEPEPEPEPIEGIEELEEVIPSYELQNREKINELVRAVNKLSQGK